MMSLVRHVIGVTSFVLFAVNTLFWIIPVIALSLLKFLLPIPFIRRIISGVLNWSASCWITLNSLLANNHCRINVEWPKDVNFSRDHWYLVIANHQSWVDIYILQRLFNRKIPFLKFFLKQQLIFVPFLGVAWHSIINSGRANAHGSGCDHSLSGRQPKLLGLFNRKNQRY